MSKPTSQLGLPDYQVTGKLALKQGQRGHSASFNWRQAAQTYEIDVWGPLGQGRTRLAGDPAQMVIARGDEVLAQGRPEEIMQTHLGWWLPIGVLPYWIRGIPQIPAEVEDIEQDDEGRVTAFTEQNWQVQLSGYQPVSSTIPDEMPSLTPRRIVAQREAVRITLVIRDFLQ